MTFVKNYTPWNKGKHTGLIPWNKDKTHSEETKQNLREHTARYWLGKKFSAKHRKKISLAKKGLPSPLKGRKRPYTSPEHRRNLSIANTGKHHSLETRKKMSEWQKGKHKSLQTRKKQSIAMKSYWKKKHGSKT
jgi:NUMOD3 motif